MATNKFNLVMVRHTLFLIANFWPKFWEVQLRKLG